VNEDMDVTLHRFIGDITPRVRFIEKNPDNEHDRDLWIVTLEQGDNEIRIYYNDYGDLHTFATRLMAEVASARP